MTYGENLLAEEMLRTSAFLEDRRSRRQALGGAFAAGHRRGLVLLVDDSPAMLEVLSDILHYLGCEVVAALNGQEGLALYERLRRNVGLVILSMNLPVMNGEETMSRLRQQSATVPIVVTSRIGEQEARRRCLALGQPIEHFLPKPYDLQQAEALLDRLTRG